MNRKKLRANILLLLAALFWGSTFVAQRIAAGAIDPFPFQCLRCLLGALVLYLCVPLFDKYLSRGTWSSRPLWLGGVLCGICLFASTNLQQFGISLGTTAGKSGFITALYIVLVPVFSIFLGRRSGALVWISVILAACSRARRPSSRACPRGRRSPRAGSPSSTPASSPPPWLIHSRSLPSAIPIPPWPRCS